MMLKIVIIFALASTCILAADECNEEVSGSFGSIVSPGYPIEQYANNLDCNFKIKTSIGTGIMIDIVDMNLETEYDFINIYDGPTNDSKILGKYTGTASGIDVYTTENEALIYFHSDSSVQADGFYIYFEETEPDFVCPVGNFTDDSGFFESPLYPSPYPNNTDCYYSIGTSLDTQITLHINSFDVELSTDCSKDYLEIFDGPTIESKLLAKLCGYGPFHDIVSSTNQVFAHFHSDSSGDGSGFKVSYSTSACSGPILYQGDFGTIYSPGYPIKNYPNFASCNYTVITPPGSQVLFYVTYINLESNHGCTFDSLRIYDGPDNTDNQLAEFCGYNSSISIQASNNEVLLEFSSDGSVNYEGFIITYVATYYYD